MKWKLSAETSARFSSQCVNKTVTNELDVHSCKHMYFIFNLRMKIFYLKYLDSLVLYDFS